MFKQFLQFFSVRCLLAIRVCIQSYAHPDEFWQGPEVAHKEVFGRGYLTWEWTSDMPLRSPIYHSIFVVYYMILKMLGLDLDFLVQYGPRFMQCLISALYDVYLMKLAVLLGVSRRYILLVHFSSWFSIYVMSRTLINNFESCLFLIALYHWKSFTTYQRSVDNWICRALVILNFVARGTSIVPWVFIWPFHLLTYRVLSKNVLLDKFKVLLINVFTVILMLIFSIVVDSLYYGKLTSTIWNFAQFNLIKGLASFYGVHSTFWLFFLVVPYMFLGWAILLPFGLYNQVKKQLQQRQYPEDLFICGFFMGVISLSAHKEDRFLLPVFPILYIWIALGLELLDTKSEKLRLLDKVQSFKRFLLCKRVLIVLALLSNLIMIVFFNFFVNAGALTVFLLIYPQTLNKLKDMPDLKSAQFLLQCHSTPFYSFVHRDIPMYQPDCSPLTKFTESENYRLFHDTENFIQSVVKERSPSHLLIYDFLYDRVKDQLSRQGYVVVERTWHSTFVETVAGYYNDVSIYILAKL